MHLISTDKREKNDNFIAVILKSNQINGKATFTKSNMGLSFIAMFTYNAMG